MHARTQLTAEAHAAIERAALAAWPREMVALLGGRDGRVDDVLVLHDAHTGDDSFAVDAVTFARGEQALRARGRAFSGFVHSHPDGSAAPSERDRRELWRGCLQLVAATDGEQVTLRAFRLVGERVDPVALDVAAEALP